MVITMDAPVQDINVQDFFSNENLDYVYQDTISPALSGENGVVKFDSNGNYYNLNYNNGNPVVIKRSNKTGELLSQLSVPEQILSNSIHRLANNLENYQLALKTLEYFQTDEGREEELTTLKNSFGVNRDPLMNAVVSDVMNQLQDGIAVIHPDVRTKPYNYFVNNQNTVNACSGLNRNVSVNQGFIRFFDYDKDYIMATLAHEIAHGEQKHVTATERLITNINAAMILTGSKVDQRYSYFLNRNWSQIGLTKQCEKEADMIAFDYLVNAGANPGALPASFIKLTSAVIPQAETTFTKSYNPDNHPSFIDRIHTYTKKMSEYSYNRVGIKEDGTLTIDGQPFFKPSDTGLYTGIERSYLAMGNLSTAIHNNMGNVKPYAKDNVLMIGDKPIITCSQNDLSASDLAKRFSEIQDNTKNFLSITHELLNSSTLSDSSLSQPQYKTLSNIPNFSYVVMYDKDGKIKKVDEHFETKKSFDMLKNLSLHTSNTVEELKSLDLSKSSADVGKDAGKILAKLLEDKNTVDFFATLSKKSNIISNSFSDKLNSYSNTISKVGYNNLEPFYEDFMTNFTTALGAYNNNSTPLKLKNFNLSLPTYHDASIHKTATFSSMVSQLRDISHDETFKKALIDELKDHPKAMENYRKIISVQGEILNDMEKVHFNAFDTRVKLSDSKIKDLSEVFKETKRYYSNLASGKNSDSKLSPVVKNHIITSKFVNFESESLKLLNELNSMKYSLKAMTAIHPAHKDVYNDKFTNQEKHIQKMQSDLKKSLPKFQLKSPSDAKHISSAKLKTVERGLNSNIKNNSNTKNDYYFSR